MGVEDAETVVNAVMVVVVALVGLYGRYRALGVTWWGMKKWVLAKQRKPQAGTCGFFCGQLTQ